MTIRRLWCVPGLSLIDCLCYECAGLLLITCHSIFAYGCLSLSCLPTPVPHYPFHSFCYLPSYPCPSLSLPLLSFSFPILAPPSLLPSYPCPSFPSPSLSLPLLLSVLPPFPHLTLALLHMQASAMLMSALLAMVPIVDSSKATEYHDLTEVGGSLPH